MSRSEMENDLQAVEEELRREEQRLASKERAPHEGRVTDPNEWRRSLHAVRTRVDMLRGERRLIRDLLLGDRLRGRSE